MKNIAIYLTLFIGLSAANVSCKKDSTDNTVRQTITETLKVNQSYQFDLGRFGREEGASISKQATHYSNSSVERDPNTGNLIYNYTAATNFVGTDEVELKSARGSNGSGTYNQIVVTTIKFTVTN